MGLLGLRRGLDSAKMSRVLWLGFHTWPQAELHALRLRRFDGMVGLWYTIYELFGFIWNGRRL